jgi:23S rRNA (adenine-N6)-dimethyltransferase
MAIIARIDRRQFTPVPKVNAVLAMFKRRPKPLVEPQLKQLFRDFVVYGYNQWQPTVLEAFGKIFTHKQRAILEKNAKIHGAKPRDLILNQWLILFAAFVDYVSDDRKGPVRGAEERLKKQQEKLQKQFRTR